jgi:hypothetical protein
MGSCLAFVRAQNDICFGKIWELFFADAGIIINNNIVGLSICALSSAYLPLK